MKKANLKTEAPSDGQLLSRIRLLAEPDLCIPSVEEDVREALGALRQRGYSFLKTDIDDPDCYSCLDMALQSAAMLRPKKKQANAE